MISLNDVKEELSIELTDTSLDTKIEKEIANSIKLVKRYCNNPDMEFLDETSEFYVDDLDDVLLYLVAVKMNVDTKIGNTAGKASHEGAIKVQFREDFPIFIKELLKAYKKNKKAKFL